MRHSAVVLSIILVLVGASLSAGYSKKSGLTAFYKDGELSIVFENKTDKDESIARFSRNTPILDIEESVWYGWKQIYPAKPTTRLKKGVDKIKPGKRRVYWMKIKLNKKSKYRLHIHGFGGTPIRMK